MPTPPTKIWVWLEGNSTCACLALSSAAGLGSLGAGVPWGASGLQDAAVASASEVASEAASERVAAPGRRARSLR